MPVEKGPAGVETEMHKFKTGTLHSGSESGPIVRKRSQAIAIALKEAGLSRQQKGMSKPRSSSPKSMSS